MNREIIPPLCDRILQKQISIPDPEKIALAGPGERNFVCLEEECGIQMLSRATGLTLHGDSQEALDRAEQTLDHLRERLKNGGTISEEAVRELARPTEAAESEGSGRIWLRRPVLLDRYGKPVFARSPGQEALLQAIETHDLVFASGPAGTGKTFLSIAMAVAYLQQGRIERLVLVRPAVESGENLGFLPGDVTEKIGPYMTPLFDSLYQLLPSDKVHALRESLTVEIAPLAYMRGRTLSRSFIILDEAQNTTIPQMKMFLTRIGPGSKAVVAGDETQIDLPGSRQPGLLHAMKILAGTRGVGFCALTAVDVARHRLVKDIIAAYGREQVPTPSANPSANPP